MYESIIHDLTNRNNICPRIEALLCEKTRKNKRGKEKGEGEGRKKGRRRLKVKKDWIQNIDR